jgi:hypothetical protein
MTISLKWLTPMNRRVALSGVRGVEVGGLRCISLFDALAVNCKAGPLGARDSCPLEVPDPTRGAVKRLDGAETNLTRPGS